MGQLPFLLIRKIGNNKNLFFFKINNIFEQYNNCLIMKKYVFILLLLSISSSFCQIKYDIKSSGVKKSKGLMRISKNGELLNGIVFGNYKNGQLSFEYGYKNGKRDGLCKQWNKNGQLIWEREFKNGLQHGIDKAWDKNGQLSWELFYKNGLKDGHAKFYDQNGEIIMEELYDNGKKVKKN
jgi:antitoxin component YwqK of YwqJK toxin-antitoxin module